VSNEGVVAIPLSSSLPRTVVVIASCVFSQSHRLLSPSFVMVDVREGKRQGS
jgi:hypothetical protein